MNWRPCLYAAVLAFTTLSHASAQIYRWDNGQVIPGTEGLKLGPSMQLHSWNSADHNLRYGDFSGDLARSQFYSSWLDRARFINADLTDARFSRATMTNGNLTGANLARTTLQQTDFTNAKLIGVDLTGANLEGAILNNANLSGAVVANAKFTDTTSQGFASSQLYSTASYQNKDLRAMVLSQNDLSGWDLSGQNLTGSLMQSVNLSQAKLTNANLSGTILLGGIAGADFAGANFAGARGSFNSGTANFSGATFHGANLEFSDLNHSNFTGADFAGARVGGTWLTDANFTDAIVSRASLNNTTRFGFKADQLYATASYKSKDLRGMFLGVNNLDGWDFGGQDLTDTSFGSSSMRGSNLAGANLTRTSFNSVDLTNADMSGSLIYGAEFVGRYNSGPQVISPAQLYSTASYQSQNLQKIRFGLLDLQNWDFRGQDLREASFYGSVVNNAKFDGAIVQATDFTGITGLSAEQLYSTASYQNHDLRGIRLGYNNNLPYWNFNGQNLVGAYLAGSSLTGATFENALVSGADFSRDPNDNRGTGLTPAQLASTASYRAHDLKGVKLNNNFLNGADFSRQDMMNAMFGSATLKGANFSNANLQNAYLQHANQVGMNLTGADLRGAVNALYGLGTARNAILPDGLIDGLNLKSGEELVIRDDDGLASTNGYVPARDPLPIFVQYELEMAEDSLLRTEFDTDYWNSRISFEAGTPVKLGGILDLTFVADVPLASQSGRTIKIFDWTGVNPQGTFTVQGQPGTAWDTSRLYSTGEVTLLGISSDLNADRDVDSEDLLEFLANWTGSDSPVGDKTWREGDSDADGDVDSADMLVFLSQWTGAAAEASRVASVPEPISGSVFYAAIVGTMLVNRRRRGWAVCPIR